MMMMMITTVSQSIVSQHPSTKPWIFDDICISLGWVSIEGFHQLPRKPSGLFTLASSCHFKDATKGTSAQMLSNLTNQQTETPTNAFKKNCQTIS